MYKKYEVYVKDFIWDLAVKKKWLVDKYTKGGFTAISINGERILIGIKALKIYDDLINRGIENDKICEWLIEVIKEEIKNDSKICEEFELNFLNFENRKYSKIIKIIPL